MKPTQSKSPGVGLETIRREDERLAELQGTLLATLTERTEPITRVTHLLEMIREVVAAHGCDEDRGILHECAAKEPKFAARCQQLCNEHERLTTMLDVVYALASDSEKVTPADRWRLMESSFIDFNRELTQHEQRETALIDELKRASANDTK